MNYIVTIGLEIHLETKSKTKMFSAASTNFDAPPNSSVSPTDMAFPGTLPVVNKKSVENAVMLCHALNLKIDNELHFDRKNYYYSDLPKGYQITQERRPIGSEGRVVINTTNGPKTIRIQRLHMEEDTARQFHIADYTMIDYNRAGIPLVEIVTYPDITNAEEAMAFVEFIREIATFTGTSDGKMEEGSLRCDVNISLRPEGTTVYGTKVEVKNLNSISNIGKVIEAEIVRQGKLLDEGKIILSETRRYDETLKDTVLMRMKDNVVDYKYFPEGNIAPIHLSEDYIKGIIARIPELPQEKRLRYETKLGLGSHEIKILFQSKELTFYFDEAVKSAKNPKLLANFLIGEFAEFLNKNRLSISESKLQPLTLTKLCNLISDGAVSNAQARVIFNQIVATNEEPETIAKKLGLIQENDEGAILLIINTVIDENLALIDEIKAGKDRAIGFLVGQVMKKSGGKVNPALANKLMKEEINKR